MTKIPETIVDRVERVMDDLDALQREVEGLGHFLGGYHAVNGVRQAKTELAITRSWLARRQVVVDSREDVG